MLRNLLVITILYISATNACAGLVMYAACENDGESKNVITLEKHPFAMNPEYPPACVKIENAYSIKEIEYADSYVQAPLPHEIQMHEQLIKSLPKDVQADPLKKKTVVIIKVHSRYELELQKWTKHNEGNLIILSFNKKVVFVARILSSLNGGVILMQSDVLPLSKAKMLVNEVTKSYKNGLTK